MCGGAGRGPGRSGRPFGVYFLKGRLQKRRTETSYRSLRVGKRTREWSTRTRNGDVCERSGNGVSTRRTRALDAFFVRTNGRGDEGRNDAQRVREREQVRTAKETPASGSQNVQPPRHGHGQSVARLRWSSLRHEDFVTTYLRFSMALTAHGDFSDEGPISKMKDTAVCETRKTQIVTVEFSENTSILNLERLDERSRYETYAGECEAARWGGSAVAARFPIIQFKSQPEFILARTYASRTRICAITVTPAFFDAVSLDRGHAKTSTVHGRIQLRARSHKWRRAIQPRDNTHLAPSRPFSFTCCPSKVEDGTGNGAHLISQSRTNGRKGCAEIDSE
ncbi:hypothetical protein AB1N83_003452 [Pleurotus pulmonarius]